MEVIILETPKAIAVRAAQIFSETLKKKPRANLGLATGTTPIPVYQKLIKMFRAKKISFKDVSTFNLDEYVGISEDDTRGYRHFMSKQLFDFVDIDKKRTFFPACIDLSNHEQIAQEYEDKIASLKGIDLQLLGIGENGHIGFNEPSSSLASRTRLKTLTQSTMDANSRLFNPDEEQPTMAMTMGIATIMEAKHILLIATGKNKAHAVVNTVEGAVSAACPSSILQMHPKVTLLLDLEAASELKHKTYYQWVAKQVDSFKKNK